MNQNTPIQYYKCHFCGDEQLHLANDLYWSDRHTDWVCTMCWEDEQLPVDKHGIRLDEYLTGRKVEVESNTTFEIVVTKNTKKVDPRTVREDWMKELYDPESWAINDEGNLVLLDAVGRFAYAPLGMYFVHIRVFDYWTSKTPDGSIDVEEVDYE